MSITRLEPGHILSIGNAISVAGLTVYVTVDEVLIPIGKIRVDYIKWFDQTNPEQILDKATKVVYIEDGVFGIRQMTNPWDEFKALSESNQREVIQKYVELMNED